MDPNNNNNPPGSNIPPNLTSTPADIPTAPQDPTWGASPPPPVIEPASVAPAELVQPPVPPAADPTPATFSPPMPSPDANMVTPLARGADLGVTPPLASPVTSDAQPWSLPPSALEPAVFPSPSTGDLSPAPDQAPAAAEPVPTFTTPALPQAADLVTPLPGPMTQPDPAPAWPGTPTPFSADSVPTVPPPPDNDSSPTDLSHLVDDLTPASVPVPEAPVVTTSPADVNQAVTSGHGYGFPKWVLLIGLVVLLMVGGASAYFILGLGQSNQSTAPTSAPLEQQPLTNSPKSMIPPQVQPTALPSGTASFTNLSGAVTPTPVATPSGSSAIDLLKSRQGR